MGGRLRIAVQLVETADYCCLWSEVLECDDAGVGLVRETISQAIIAALTTSLVGQATPRLSPRQTESPEFHNLYLKGRYHLNRRTAEGLRRAIGYFTQLIACSPRYARAHAGLAEALVLLTWYGHAAPNHAMPKAKASALRAVQEDTRLAEAHLALGLVSQLFDWDWARARQSLQLALELSPGSATALFEFGFFLSRMGDLDEAFATMRRAQELDPLSPLINTNLGVNYYYQRNYNQAVRQFEDALELDPGYQPAHYRLAMAYLQMARVNDAIACLEKGLRLPGASPLVLALSGCAMARSGRKDRALEIRDALLASSGDHYISPVSIAILCMGMNENRQALDWLAHGWEEHDMLLVDLKIDPLFDPLRGQPGFRKLLAGMNLSRSTASC
jgi:tetratricopeptide (TPR) repeat protein